MLLYETSLSELVPDVTGRMAIFGEVEVIGDFYKDELTAPSPQHPWLVRVMPIRLFPVVQLIPRSIICNIIGDRDFPQRDETWRKLSDEQYQKLILHFEKPGED